MSLKFKLIAAATVVGGILLYSGLKFILSVGFFALVVAGLAYVGMKRLRPSKD